MTLADLKRKLQPGTTLTMTYNSTGKSALLNVPRAIVKANTTGCWLEHEGKKSFLEYPSHAGLVDVQVDGFTVYEPGYRPLTPDEQRIMDNEPRNPEQERIDMLTDGSQMFWKRKRYYTDAGALYLFGTEEVKGMYYDYNTKQIRDRHIKGEKSLAYTFSS